MPFSQKPSKSTFPFLLAAKKGKFCGGDTVQVTTNAAP
jgi:hypothetical protein